MSISRLIAAKDSVGAPVRAISDPLEHLVNQVEIRHQPSYLAK